MKVWRCWRAESGRVGGRGDGDGVGEEDVSSLRKSGKTEDDEGVGGLKVWRVRDKRFGADRRRVRRRGVGIEKPVREREERLRREEEGRERERERGVEL